MRSTSKFKSLPYNPALRDRARHLRRVGLLHEVLLWQELRSAKLNGLDFDRQKVIGNYIVDFYCAEAQTIIEVDGASHDNTVECDEARDIFLTELGLTVIRLSVKGVLHDLTNTLEFLKNHPALKGTPPAEGNPKG